MDAVTEGADARLSQSSLGISSIPQSGMNLISVRIVWITLLAMSDASGFVQSSLPGLAHQCRKTREETISALQVLEVA